MKNRKTTLTKQISRFDKKLFFLIIALVTIGLIFIADVSAPQALNNYGDKFRLLKQQSISAIIGIAAFFIFSKIKYTFWKKLAVPLFLISVILLILVLIQGFGFSALGARRWLVLGSINFQPSELVKFTIVLYLAKVASANKSTLSYLIPLALVAILIMMEPDLGTTLIIMIIGFSQIFVSNVNLIYVFGSMGLGFIVATLLIFFSPYRKARLMTFIQGTSDPLGNSYHVRQILLGLGSGGIFGVGFGSSRQKFLFLPEASTDSIFAVIAEELGLIGAFVIIFLFALFLIRGLKIAKNSPDIFASVLATGIAAWISGQAFLNIASMVSLVPLTGIPLPFISYGGSSLVMVLSACGILLNISKFTTHDQK